jgi:DNA-binding LytR/AlgR family response regulator
MARALLHVNDGRRRVVNTDSVYYLEAVGGDTLLRRRRAKPLEDIRNLGAILRVWKRFKFVRIHKNHAVNPDHILEIRRRKNRKDWEVKLTPPVNVILPVSRNYLSKLWAAFGQSR